MNTFASTLLVSAALIGTTAYAGQEPSGELDYPPAITQTTSLTRAQVHAELQQARAAGLVTFGEIEQPATQNAASTITRAQVQAQAQAARAHGPVAFGGEGYPQTGA